jgi:hypothetical protein
VFLVITLNGDDANFHPVSVARRLAILAGSAGCN